MLYVGGGVIRSEASAELLKLAELTGAPVVTTLMARGAFPDSHPQHLGMPGMHGSVPAVLAPAAERPARLARRPLRRPRDRQGRRSSRRDAKIVHVDIDPAEIGKIRQADVPIVGDAKDVIVDLIAAYADAVKAHPADVAAWWAHLEQLRTDYPLGLHGSG